MNLLKEIEKASQNLKGVAKNTPLELSQRLSKKFRANIFLKREDLQEIRSFKIRGAFNKIKNLLSKDLKNGIVCASAGNHAQGVAFSCKKLKIDGKEEKSFAFGNGPVDASFKAIDKIIKKKIHLEEYLVQAVTSGSDDVGKVHVQIKYKNQIYYGFGADTDIVVASAKAYLDALNKII